TGTAQLEFQAQVEVGRIDADEHVRLRRNEVTSELTAATEQFEQPAEHFDQPHDCQTLHGEVGFQPLGLHARATDADELGIRIALLDGLHQARAEDVTGRLTGDQCDAKGSGHRNQRVMPRVEAWTESRKIATSGNCAADSANSFSACSTVNPWR